MEIGEKIENRKSKAESRKPKVESRKSKTESCCIATFGRDRDGSTTWREWEDVKLKDEGCRMKVGGRRLMATRSPAPLFPAGGRLGKGPVVERVNIGAA